jgi:hypothetical protein
MNGEETRMPLPVLTAVADIEAICGYLIAKPDGASQRTLAWLNRCRRLAKDWENLNRKRSELHDQIGGLRKEIHEDFAAINRRLDHIIQMQLDEHARGSTSFKPLFSRHNIPVLPTTSQPTPFNSLQRDFPRAVTRRHTPFRAHAKRILCTQLP